MVKSSFPVHIQVKLTLHRAVSILLQALLFSLTSYRFYNTLKAGWRDVPLMSVLIRDGTWAFFLLFCKSGSMMMCSILINPTSPFLGLWDPLNYST